ncbi:hypothetical protein CIHG_09043 [Coccidioides immitis H538.4]|uniref:Uncharacterized protein n=1 Tax=Coccidioides immitis H538.4 TaxID=396776 RepID=A0A0J8S333_COCIT|nr:hypothetical protein CIHG_09043 [Coccidioides immitis H538.4]
MNLGWRYDNGDDDDEELPTSGEDAVILVSNYGEYLQSDADLAMGPWVIWIWSPWVAIVAK